VNYFEDRQEINKKDKNVSMHINDGLAFGGFNKRVSNASNKDNKNW